MRVLTARQPGAVPLDVRPIDGGLLVQQPDPVRADRAAWRVVTAATPTDEQWDDLEFAWVVCAAVSSNAIVLAKHRQAFGIGAGQQNRLDSAQHRRRARAGVRRGGVRQRRLLPVPRRPRRRRRRRRDGRDPAGRSVRDDEVIAAADEHGIAMVFTGERHFRH